MRSVWPHGGLWRHGDFLKLWSAETVSQFGSQAGQLALPLVAILVLDASAFEVAVLGTVEFLPVHHLHAPRRRLGRPAAATADPHRRRLRPRGAPAHDPASRTSPTSSSLAQLFVVGFLVGVCTVFFDVAYQSYLPSLVEREQIIEGNSKLEISRSAAQVGRAGVRRSSSSRSSRRPGPSSPTRSASSAPASSCCGSARSRSPVARDGRRREGEPVDRAEGGSPFRPRQPEPARPGRAARRRRTSSRASRSRSSSSFAVRELHLSPGLIGLIFSARCRRLAHRRLHRDAHLRRGSASGRRRSSWRHCSGPAFAARRVRAVRQRRDPDPRDARSSSSGSRWSSTTSSR